MKYNNKKVAFSAPERNFWTGFASVLNVGGSENQFNFSRTAEEDDAIALKSDWETIGRDFEQAIIDMLK